MYQTRKHAFMIYTYNYNYKTGLSAKMCNGIFDYEKRLPTCKRSREMLDTRAQALVYSQIQIVCEKKHSMRVLIFANLRII